MKEQKDYQRFAIQERVRWSDTDHARLIFYGSYLRFLEIAESELYRAAGLTTIGMFERFGIWLPRVQIHCDFVSPAVLEDLLRVDTHIGRLGRKSIKLNFEIYLVPAERLLATAHIITACVDQKDFKSTPIPEDIAQRLLPYAEIIDRD